MKEKAIRVMASLSKSNCSVIRLNTPNAKIQASKIYLRSARSGRLRNDDTRAILRI